MKIILLPKIIVKFRCALYLYVHYTQKNMVCLCLIALVVKTLYGSFLQLGLHEAATLGFSSILIYSHSVQSIYTQSRWWDAALIKLRRLK
jgi:hypothetical protein